MYLGNWNGESRSMNINAWSVFEKQPSNCNVTFTCQVLTRRGMVNVYRKVVNSFSHRVAHHVGNSADFQHGHNGWSGTDFPIRSIIELSESASSRIKRELSPSLWIASRDWDTSKQKIRKTELSKLQTSHDFISSWIRPFGAWRRLPIYYQQSSQEVQISSQRRRPVFSVQISVRKGVRSKYDTGFTLDVESLYPMNGRGQCNDSAVRRYRLSRRLLWISRLAAHIIPNGGRSAPEDMPSTIVQAHWQDSSLPDFSSQYISNE